MAELYYLLFGSVQLGEACLLISLSLPPDQPIFCKEAGELA